MTVRVRYGGELPEGADPLARETRSWDSRDLGFSHGRAAFAWILAQEPEIAWVAHCAYTCPTVPAFFDSLGVASVAFDVGASAASILNGIRDRSGRGLVLIPALFGRMPWLSDADIALLSDAGHTVVIDAAQTGFGHEDIAVPTSGAVLSCPRKACALGGGAILRLGGPMSGEEIEKFMALPVELDASTAKRRARHLFALGKEAPEMEALTFVRQSEAGWPAHACRMDDTDCKAFLALDAVEHRRRRIANAAHLSDRLKDSGFVFPDRRAGQGGVPFNFPLLMPSGTNRAALLGRLRDRRVFATALWSDAVIDRRRHPLADAYKTDLVALPLDQRFGPEDMDEIADRFLACI
ncbi:hypothetical protein HH303_13905 [Rhodospirillaceae bacterium KN72]|uniref:DegT/DnrJ/EryC1/StrS aminotransferase family protein n=1 Tax=Pacificispira spongiicola TaxID=2729598 RepID=A0A7Y0E1N3_9PROT|nr:hypothetical protein [Pacificispira spongiicola]NMM45585.1 hypothetical protein [Pacificispira spongiicola]